MTKIDSIKRNSKSIKTSLDNLIEEGDLLCKGFLVKEFTKTELPQKTQKEIDDRNSLRSYLDKKYQGWYSEAMAVLKFLLPDRLLEFVELYEIDKKRKSISPENYSIQDWLRGIRLDPLNTMFQNFDERTAVAVRFMNQIRILESAQRKFSSVLFDIKSILQADLYDSELEAALDLVNKGFIRAGGVLAGVVLEGHIKDVCTHHNLKSKKKNLTISGFNDLLKLGGIIEVTTWRHIQLLSDLRNKCGHPKEEEPSKNDVKALIDGTSKIIKSVY